MYSTLLNRNGNYNNSTSKYLSSEIIQNANMRGAMEEKLLENYLGQRKKERHRWAWNLLPG
jgi:hypothetical protein